VKKAVGELEVRTLLSGEYDERAAVVTIRAGAGGVDAADFAEMLMRMYLRWAERHGYPVKVIDTSYAEEAGLKSATFEVNVPYAYGNLSVEGGTHRLVRISPFDNQGRRQTSFAAVEVIPLIEQHRHHRDPRERAQDRRLPLQRPRRPERQHHRLRRAHDAPPHRDRGVDAEREVPDPEPRGRAARHAVALLLLKRAEEAAERKELAGDIKASWGDQMRSYVLHPYQMVKDLRTEHEVGNTTRRSSTATSTSFIEAGIRWRRNQEKADS
jgi:peptide chain release factor 2